MNADLKTMVLESVDSTYIFDLKHFFTGDMGLSTKDTMNHIMTRYLQIMADDIRDKENPLNNHWICNSRLLCSSR